MWTSYSLNHVESKGLLAGPLEALRLVALTDPLPGIQVPAGARTINVVLPASFARCKGTRSAAG